MLWVDVLPLYRYSYISRCELAQALANCFGEECITVVVSNRISRRCHSSKLGSSANRPCDADADAVSLTETVLKYSTAGSSKILYPAVRGTPCTLGMADIAFPHVAPDGVHGLG